MTQKKDQQSKAPNEQLSEEQLGTVAGGNHTEKHGSEKVEGEGEAGEKGFFFKKKKKKFGHGHGHGHHGHHG